MNNKVSYTFVGIFVLISILLMLFFSYWLMKSSNEKEMQRYNVRFEESILGLNIDAPVKYRGISVGKVLKLSINLNNSEQVEVLISILKSTPIASNTVAKLTSQGITGLSYINLSIGNTDAKPLLLKEGEKYLLIKTIPSLYNKLELTFGSVSDNLSTTLLKTQELLSDENQKQFSLLLANTANFMDKINDILNLDNQKQISLLLKNTASLMLKMDRLLDDKTIKNLQESMRNLNQASAKLDLIMPKVDKFLNNSIKWEDKISTSFASITSSYFKISSAMEEFKKAVSSGEFNIKDISSDFIPNMNNTFVEIQQLMIKLEEAINQYERSPGDMIFKQEEIKKGPGEK